MFDKNYLGHNLISLRHKFLLNHYFCQNCNIIFYYMPKTHSVYGDKNYIKVVNVSFEHPGMSKQMDIDNTLTCEEIII